jgi:hypothetical protein
LPIVFYHGQRKWSSRALADYFLNPEDVDPGPSQALAPYMMDVPYFLIDLQELGDDWIKENIRRSGLRMAMLAMRNVQSKKLPERLDTIFEGWQELKKTREGRRELKEILIYLRDGFVGSEEEIKKIMDYTANIERPYLKGSATWYMIQKAEAKGIAEGKAKGIAEGKAEGIAEGKAEGKAEVAMKMLKAGFEVAQVS